MARMYQDADARANRIAEGQFGLIGLAQALAAGHTKSSIGHRLHQGRWTLFRPRVYAIAGTPSSWHRDAMGACLWGGDETALSHGAAGRAWAFDGFGTAPVEVSLIGHKRAVDLPFKVHRVNGFLVPEIARVGALPVTSVRRTLLDLAGVRDRRAEGALDQALLRRQTTLGQMWLLYEEEWTRGRRGIAILRGFLAERTEGNAPTQSDLERLLMGIVRDFALPEPVRQHPITLPFGDIHADFCYPEARLVIETDGYAVHSDRESFERDRERDAELLLLGWRTLRFTWAQLTWRRGWVAETIRAHLAVAHDRVVPQHP